MSQSVLRRRIATGLGLAAAVALISGCSATPVAGGDAGQATSVPIEIPNADGPGVTADTITISWGRGAFPSAEDEAGQKRTQEAAAALVAQLNDDGGIAGRKVVLADPDPSAELLAQRSQAFENNNFLPLPDPSNGAELCDAYAESDVFAVLYSPAISSPFGTAAAGACLNDAGHPVIGVNSWGLDDFRAAPATAGLSIATERYYDALVAAADDAAFFDSEGKFAVITDEAADDALITSRFIPALEEKGAGDVQMFPMSATASSADALNLAVKLKGGGFDHVIFGAEDSFPFVASLLPVMQQQDYAPELLSVDGLKLDVLALMGTVETSAELIETSHAYLSRANTDMAQLSDDQKKTPGGKLWDTVVTENPELRPDPSMADSLTLLKAAIESSGSEYINAQAFTVGLNSLEDYQSMTFFRTDFSADRHDGGAGIVSASYDAECQCVQLSPDVVEF